MNLPSDHNAGPAAPTKIDGTIINGTPGQTVPANLTADVEYQRNQRSQQDHQSDAPSSSDVNGHFVITETQMSHGDLMRARTDYKDLLTSAMWLPVGLQVTLADHDLRKHAGRLARCAIDMLHVIAQPTRRRA